MLKHVYDFTQETHHDVTRWARIFLKGMVAGCMLGAPYSYMYPDHPMAFAKLNTHLGSRAFSGGHLRYFKAVMLPYAMFGGSIFLGYDLIFRIMRASEEATDRPLIVDHWVATTILSAYTGMVMTNCIENTAFITTAGFFVAAPMLWMFHTNNFKSANHDHPNIFY
jgi:hypothetical protein